MGAWGTGPFDNDNACDWRDTNIAGIIKETILSSNVADELFAALSMVESANLSFNYTKAELVAAFDKIAAADSVANWKNYRERQRLVTNLKETLLDDWRGE